MRNCALFPQQIAALRWLMVCNTHRYRVAFLLRACHASSLCVGLTHSTRHDSLMSVFFLCFFRSTCFSTLPIHPACSFVEQLSSLHEWQLAEWIDTIQAVRVWYMLTYPSSSSSTSRKKLFFFTQFYTKQVMSIACGLSSIIWGEMSAGKPWLQISRRHPAGAISADRVRKRRVSDTPPPLTVYGTWPAIWGWHECSHQTWKQLGFVANHFVAFSHRP